MQRYIDPGEKNFRTFKDLPRDRPIHMLNLLLFRDHADYPAGHANADRGWTGREAYAEYSRTSGAVFQRVGGSIVWRGAFQTMVTGPHDREWHSGFVAQYPDSGAFFAMIKDAEYQAAVANRTAALLDSRLIRFEPEETTTGFA